MTKREFLEAIVNGTMSDEISAYAAESLNKMDAANAARREKAATATSKKAIENAPLVEKVVGLLTAEPQTTSALAEVMELSVQKTSALLRSAVAQGKAVQSEVKVPKKGTVKAYAIA